MPSAYPMVVGILQFELLIHGAESLKDKRRVVNSLKDRLHREHMVSVAEVGAPDDMAVALMGLACVGTAGKRVAEVLDKVAAKLRTIQGAELGNCRREILHGVYAEESVPLPTEPDSIVQEMMDRMRREQAGGEAA
jgi:uncharacterized protein YlxP (DUF503 family)